MSLINEADTSAAATAAAIHTVAPPATFSPAEDRLDGVPAIAAYMGVSTRVARYKLAQGHWPFTKEGSRFVASRSALSEHWRKATSAAVPDQAAA